MEELETWEILGFFCLSSYCFPSLTFLHIVLIHHFWMIESLESFFFLTFSLPCTWRFDYDSLGAFQSLLLLTTLTIRSNMQYISYGGIWGTMLLLRSFSFLVLSQYILLNYIWHFFFGEFGYYKICWSNVFYSINWNRRPCCTFLVCTFRFAPAASNIVRWVLLVVQTCFILVVRNLKHLFGNQTNTRIKDHISDS